MTDNPRATDVASIAKAARDRLPGLVDQIEQLTRKIDPVELLAQLTLLFQTHSAHVSAYRDESTNWQVRIEWLAWLMFGHGLAAPPEPEIIDARILGPLESILDEYFESVALTLLEPALGLSREQDDLRSDIRIEALFVRGEGFQYQIECSANELYTSHDEWCVTNLGLTVRDAFSIAKALAACFTLKMQSLRNEQTEIQARIRTNPALALELDLPPTIHGALKEGSLRLESDDQVAAIAGVWFFSKAASIVGFTVDELEAQVAGQIAPERVAGFLNLISISRGDIHGDPNPFALNPLAKTPLLRDGARYYLFVPGVLYQAIQYAFHSRLFADQSYRTTYDDARASLMERLAVEAFRRMLPNAESGWRLEYGPKQHRTEVDGLVYYDGKLILVECKWKALRLASLEGDVDAALADIDKAIVDPLTQAKRARDHIEQQGQVEFTEKTSGRRIIVRAADVSEVFLVTLLGSGAWARIAANLPRLVPLGLFVDGEFPWALPLNDLVVVSECLDSLPTQLFDYLRRRYQMQRDPRFVLHDEWDVLGVYLAGALDVANPRFPTASQAHRVALDGFDQELQDYYYSLSNHHALRVKKPRRQIPANVLELLKAVDRGSTPGRTDAICILLGWPDDGLTELSKVLVELRQKTIWDGRAHAWTGKHPWNPTGIALACGLRCYHKITFTFYEARPCSSNSATSGAGGC